MPLISDPAAKEAFPSLALAATDGTPRVVRSVPSSSKVNGSVPLAPPTRPTFGFH